MSLDFPTRIRYITVMQRLRVALVFSVAMAFSACETPIGDAWNNAVSKMSPNREDDSAARNGINSQQPSGQTRNIDSDTVYLGPKRPASQPNRPAPTSGPVRLKPFRSATGAKPHPTEQAAARSGTDSLPKPTPHANASATPRLTPKPTPKPTPKTTPKPTPKPAAEGEISEKSNPTPAPENAPPPFASPVPGKKGYVTSPFSPDAGFIDVTGLDPGSEAKDPYSGKIFRVP